MADAGEVAHQFHQDIQEAIEELVLGILIDEEEGPLDPLLGESDLGPLLGREPQGGIIEGEKGVEGLLAMLRNRVEEFSGPELGVEEVGMAPSGCLEVGASGLQGAMKGGIVKVSDFQPPFTVGGVFGVDLDLLLKDLDALGRLLRRGPTEADGKVGRRGLGPKAPSPS